VAALALVENVTPSYHEGCRFTIRAAGCPDVARHATICRVIARQPARYEAKAQPGHAIKMGGLFPARRGTRTTERPMAEGTIKRLTDKGFGFISNASGKDMFFHMSAVEGTRFEDLREGQKVSYNEGHGPKGPRAENVRVI
jgi:CspA family cold shock protein